MFDDEFRNVADAALIEAIKAAAVAAAAATALGLAAVAELTARRCGDDEHAHWACDEWDAAAAEVSAALGISHGRASGQMHLGLSLRYRLPKVAALFLEGALSARVAAAIAWRTDLVQDGAALALIDSSIAENAGGWDGLSQHKLEQAVDVWVDRHDPGALRRTQASARSRDVTIGGQDPESGTAALWGRLLATDAAVLERKLTQMAHQVCEDDPRTIAQRRADALGSLAAGVQTLACQCGGPNCSAPDPRASGVVIHVLADSEAVAARPGTAVITGGGVVPTPLLAELIRGGAKIRHLRRPPAAAESKYRPSTALDEFVRMRDMTCRFPNCDRPAEACDIDHAVPWPDGPTHPSNMRCLCRKHHLLKTFWTGWTDRQSADGTIVWTSPTGHTYTTRPGSRLLFPRWDTATGEAPKLPKSAQSANRGLMMPARRRTRSAARAYRIRCERSLNDAHVAARNMPPPY
ncbi:MAG TPA: DUF222 domain-containing protein [Mycobacterium sp.]|uniref:HNH endonuclease signature motif containing protein n=1 Tax=Mycolicibacterium sp. TaxID=2320850 RepID=UPI0025CE17CC|nr:HNH endonuclease signature motif containing protein [Mycolicibacterium sp.]HPX35087.1 DUF222 domain-containing protein [Mycobacterium sp.]